MRPMAAADGQHVALAVVGYRSEQLLLICRQLRQINLHLIQWRSVLPQ